jgi:GH24 family phage-related lysozyme (muramidase)
MAMISAEIKTKVKSLLILHENCKLFPYIDTTGNLSIGYGRNLTEN